MDAGKEILPARYRIRDLILDSGTRQVTRNGEPLKLGGLTFDLLLALVEASPTIVTYDALADRVWRGRPVAPETQAQRAKMLREALSDDAGSPRYFEVVRGQGYRLVANAETLDPEPSGTSTTWAVYLLIAAVAAVSLYFAFNPPLTEHDRLPSVAVLPFADMSQAGDQQYLADGVAEELINQLTSLDGLEVASRTESFYFREESGDLSEIGKRLGVTAVIEGSIRRSDDDIRITVQVIDVDSGYHLWSDTFDRKLADIFAIQDEIALAVVGALGVHLGVGEVNEFLGAGTTNFKAYEAYLRDDFASAISFDPDYAAAWGAEGIRIAATMWVNPPQKAPAIVERAHGFVARAVELDPNSSQAHTNYATLIYVTKAWQEAEASYARALTLRRNEYSLGHYANMLMRTGRSSRAHDIHLERDAMLRLDEMPTDLRINVDIARGKLESAREKTLRMADNPRREMALIVALNVGSIEHIQAAIADMPEHWQSYRVLYGPIRDLLEEPDAAFAYLRDLLNDADRMWPDKYMSIALVAAYLGDPEFAFDAFSRELYFTTVRYGALWYPVMREVRQLPAFKRFLVDVNLVDYWRAYGWSDFCWPQGEDDFACQ